MGQMALEPVLDAVGGAVEGGLAEGGGAAAEGGASAGGGGGGGMMKKVMDALPGNQAMGAINKVAEFFQGAHSLGIHNQGSDGLGNTSDGVTDGVRSA